MGEYAKTNEMLRQAEAKLERIREAIRIATDEEELEYLYEDLADAEQSVGEIEGCLLEMAEVDGLDDVFEAFDY